LLYLAIAGISCSKRMTQTIAQILGYFATLLLAVSLMVNNELRFRWLNTLGCVCFIIYGAVIGALPVMLTNMLLLLINVWYLVKIYRTNEQFEIITFLPGEKIAERFLDFYEKDIHRYFPNYRSSLQENDIRMLVLRDMVITNVFICSLQADGTAYVKINYTIAKYRDYKVGKYLFIKENSMLREKGVKQVCYEKVSNPSHAKFLIRMGFTRSDDEMSYYRKLS
jgi:hypothetical protein